jgi:hypothetical protein
MTKVASCTNTSDYTTHRWPATHTHTHRLQAYVQLHTHTAAYGLISSCIHTQTHICVQTDGQLYKCSSRGQADGQLHTSNCQQREGQLHICSWLQVNDCTTCTMYSCLQTAVYIKMVSCTQTADNIQMAAAHMQLTIGRWPAVHRQLTILEESTFCDSRRIFWRD